MKQLDVYDVNKMQNVLEALNTSVTAGHITTQFTFEARWGTKFRVKFDDLIGQYVVIL